MNDDHKDGFQDGFAASWIQRGVPFVLENHINESTHKRVFGGKIKLVKSLVFNGQQNFVPLRLCRGWAWENGDARSKAGGLGRAVVAHHCSQSHSQIRRKIKQLQCVQPGAAHWHRENCWQYSRLRVCFVHLS